MMMISYSLDFFPHQQLAFHSNSNSIGMKTGDDGGTPAAVIEEAKKHYGNWIHQFLLYLI